MGYYEDLAAEARLAHRLRLGRIAENAQSRVLALICEAQEIVAETQRETGVSIDPETALADAAYWLGDVRIEALFEDREARS